MDNIPVVCDLQIEVQPINESTDLFQGINIAVSQVNNIYGRKIMSMGHTGGGKKQTCTS